MILDKLMPNPDADGKENVVEVRWARAWLIEVSEARKALERADRVAELRRAQAYALPSPMAGMGDSVGKGGVRDRMRAVDEMIDAEAATDALDWACDALALFDHMADVNRRTLRGAMLDGLDIAELRYAAGCSDNQICSAFKISRSKLYNDLNAFVDYLDYLGPEKAFNLGDNCMGLPAEIPDMSLSANPTYGHPHADAYATLRALVSETLAD